MSEKIIINGLEYNYFDLKALDATKINRMPYSHKILLENALRHAESNDNNDIETILNSNFKIINRSLSLSSP